MKPILILLHAALGSKEQFKEIKESLSPYFQVLDFNFEGHGGLDSQKEYSIDLFVDNVIEYMDKNLILKANFFGYSMGGYVALKFAMKYPNKVSKIVTLGTKFDWNPVVAESELKLLNPDFIEVKVPAFAQILAKRHAPYDWRVAVIKTAKMIHDLGNGKAISFSQLKTIQTPVRIIVGTKDRLVSVAESEKAAKSMPKGELYEVQDLQHPIEGVNTSELTGIIVDFFM